MNTKKCKICGDKTNTVFNINFKATQICESCAASIFIQQASWYVKNQYDEKEVEIKHNKLNISK